VRHKYQTETPDDSLAPDATFGARLRRLRKQRRITLVGFARQVGVSKPTVWNWERDAVRPRKKSIRAVAAVLGVSEIELVFGEAASAAALEGEQDLPPPRLGEVIGNCKARIAEVAGVRTENVQITIDV
jgi:transcriptional regulator with XRE-family HTH domain